MCLWDHRKSVEIVSLSKLHEAGQDSCCREQGDLRDSKIECCVRHIVLGYVQAGTVSLVNEDLVKEELKDNLKKRCQAMEVHKRESARWVEDNNANADVRVMVR
jgi:hypothetical protein